MTPNTFDDALHRFCSRHRLEEAVLRALILGDDRFAERCYLSNRGVSVDPPRPVPKAPEKAQDAPAPALESSASQRVLARLEASSRRWGTRAAKQTPPAPPRYDGPPTEALAAVRPDQAAHPGAGNGAAGNVWDRTLQAINSGATPMPGAMTSNELLAKARDA